MNRILVGIAVTLFAGCALGPRQAAAPSGSLPVRAPSVFGLLGERERLELTSAQVEAIDSIGLWLASETERIGEEFGSDERADRSQPDTTEVRTRADAITAAHVQAIDGVETLLTQTQREMVCTIQREEREERSEDDARAERRSRLGGPDGVTRARWTWCPEEQETPPPS